MVCLSGASQDIEQHKNNREIAKYKCNFQRECRFVNRSYGAEKELGSCRIWAWHLWIIQCTRLGCVQTDKCRVVWNYDVGVIAEALHAAVPQVSMNVVVQTRWHAQELNMPQSGQGKAEDDDALRKLWRGVE